MTKLCLGCMENIGDEFQTCPLCGYTDTEVLL
jgi:RNA polymerase subunit RPABC4/transcription elongation factor Spt4